MLAAGSALVWLEGMLFSGPLGGSILTLVSVAVLLGGFIAYVLSCPVVVVGCSGGLSSYHPAAWVDLACCCTPVPLSTTFSERLFHTITQKCTHTNTNG